MNEPSAKIPTATTSVAKGTFVWPADHDWVEGSASHTDPVAGAHFDLVIIGTGSANSLIGPEFDDWKIALIENGVFGGTCLNRGCIPTKMFVYPADIANEVAHAVALGVDATVNAVRWREIRDRVFGRIDPIASGGDRYRSNDCSNVTVFRGTGQFVGERRISVTRADGTQTLLSGDRVVVGVGARPTIPDIDGLDKVAFHTSDTIMRIDELPKHLVVLGGGFIANELAHVFGSYGSRVTIINRGAALLRDHDEEISQAFTQAVQGRPNFDVRLGVTVRRAEQAGDLISLTLSNGDVVECDTLLVATGRQPNSDTIAPDLGGLSLRSDGRVIVDRFGRTAAPGVWALGDISSPYMLKHVANHETRVVRHNLQAVRVGAALREPSYKAVPSAVFTWPQVASVGLTERQAREAGHEIMVKSQRFGDVAYGWAMEDKIGICKLVADKTTRKLLGAHLVGPQSSILVQQLVQAMSFDQTIDQIANEQYYIHPALSEVVENALLGLG